MPDTFTTHFNLTKVEVGGSTDTWGAKINANADAVDAELFALTDAASLVSGTLPDARLPAGIQKLAAVVTDLNTIASTGFYQHIATAANVPLAATGLVLHIAYDANNAMQFWSRADSNVAQYLRQKTGGTWGTWYLDNAVQRAGDTMAGNLSVKAPNPSLIVKSDGTAGSGAVVWSGPADEQRMLLTTPVNAQGNGSLVIGTTQAFVFNTSGQFKAPADLYAGAAFVQTNGNVQGSVWTNWGYNDAFNAISNRIEQRAQAWANDRIANMQYRKVSRGYTGSMSDGDVPGGAVVTGYVREPGMDGQVNGLYYKYLQVYDPVRGWVGFSEQ